MKNFEKLSEDERLFAQLAHYWRTLCKYYYEDIVEESLETEYNMMMLRGLGSKKETQQGGIYYYNYMFPERYENEEDPEYKKDIKYDKSSNIYAQLSIREALERYGKVNLGDFVIPPDIAAYVKAAYEAGEFGSRNIPEDKARYEAALEVVEGLVGTYDVPTQSAIAVIGALWVECAWCFDKAIINTHERDGGGINGTGGVTGAGECWFGLTFWEQKKKVIAASGAPCSTNPDEYAKAPLSSLDWDWQLKLLYIYFEKINTRWGKILLDPNGDPGEQICASYIFKAGHGREPTLSEADRTTKIYMKSHAEHGVANPINGFACQVFISAKFALWLKNKNEGNDEIPSNENVISSI